MVTMGDLSTMGGHFALVFFSPQNANPRKQRKTPEYEDSDVTLHNVYYRDPKYACKIGGKFFKTLRLCHPRES